MKTFKNLNAERGASKEELNSFFDGLMKERLAFQEKVIRDRVAISNKIKPDEWTLILAKSKESVDKAQEKVQKKSDKGKEKKPFVKTFSVIDKVINDNKKRRS